jgi:hypothetical protein
VGFWSRVLKTIPLDPHISNYCRLFQIVGELLKKKAKTGTFILGCVRVDEGEVGRVASGERGQGESCRVSSPPPLMKPWLGLLSSFNLLSGVLAWKL